MRYLGTGQDRVQVELTDYTEIGELQRASITARLALFNVQRGMQHEVEQATRELARRTAALEAASIAKARFLAAASHDLRQPLYALTLFSSALAVDENDPLRLDRIAHIQECVAGAGPPVQRVAGPVAAGDRRTCRWRSANFRWTRLFDEVSSNFRMIAEQHELRLRCVRRPRVGAQ